MNRKATHNRLSGTLLALCILLGLVSACGSNKEKLPDKMDEVFPSQTPSPADSSLESHLVFFELRNPENDPLLDRVNQGIDSTLHNQIAWIGERDIYAHVSADSNLSVVRKRYPRWSRPYVNKFFSANQIEVLRVANVTKVRLTWLPRTPAHQPQAQFTLYRNENHVWTAYANPGPFVFPSNASFEKTPMRITAEELVAEACNRIVTLSYK